MLIRKTFSLILIFGGVGLLVGLTAVHVWKSRIPNAGLKITSNLKSLVFLNGSEAGETPFDKIMSQGEVSLKIIPEATFSATPFQAMVRLSNQAYTVVHREYYENAPDSSGYIVNLTDQPGAASSIAVISTGPDGVSLSLDDQPQGIAPRVITQVAPGDHVVTVSAPGYKPLSIPILTVRGYRTNIEIQLVQLKPGTSVIQTPLPTTALPTSSTVISPPAPSPTKSPSQVVIQDTPTGFLRVRLTPVKGGIEVGQVKPQEIYQLIKTIDGWYQIGVDFESTSSGWISSEYARVK